MAHYAKVQDEKVVTVIVAEKEFFDTFVDETPGKWVQTSYNTRGGVHYEPNSNTPSSDQSKALRKIMLVLVQYMTVIKMFFIHHNLMIVGH